MNLRWFINHLASLISGVVFVVLLAGMLWFLYDANKQLDAVLEELKAQNAELHDLRVSKTFPSKENIEWVKRDRDNIRQIYEAMREVVTHPLMRGRDLPRDIDFQILKQATVNRLAETAVAQHIKTPAEFQFGFSRYKEKFPCQNPVLQDEACQRVLALLGKQLVTVEKLVNLLITNEVCSEEAIVAIRRTEVEPGGEANTDALNNSPISNNSSALYQTYPFELKFICDTTVLRNFLNGLMLQTDGLFVIRAVTIDTATVKLNTLVTPLGSGEQPVAPTTSTEPAGEERARRLTVTLRLDLVEFAPPAPPKPHAVRR